MTENTTTNNAQELSKKEKKAAYNKAYYKSNKEKLRALHKSYYEANKENAVAYNKEYRKTNKEKLRAHSSNYFQVHKEEMRTYRNSYNAKILAEDNIYAAKHKLRCSVRATFKRISQNKPANTQILLGCTWEEAKVHFESLFQEGMSWSNHGEWHIDHIRPVASFGLDELHLMNHISNLQPLWAKDNLAKSDTY